MVEPSIGFMGAGEPAAGLFGPSQDGTGNPESEVCVVAHRERKVLIRTRGGYRCNIRITHHDRFRVASHVRQPLDERVRARVYPAESFGKVTRPEQALFVSRRCLHYG